MESFRTLGNDREVLEANGYREASQMRIVIEGSACPETKCKGLLSRRQETQGCFRLD